MKTASPLTSDARRAADIPARCLNCSQPLPAVAAQLPARFCPACGQETNVKPPTLREFAQQFGGAYFATEGALWRTLKLLLFQPGELTRRYLIGQRKHYVLPLRLYLTISVVSLLLLRTAGGAGVIQIHVQPDEANAAVRELRNIDIAGGRAGRRDGVFFCNDLPAWFCRRLQSRIDVDAKAFAAEMEQTKQRFIANLGSALFVLLPSFALWLKLVYVNRGLRYTEHLVFALHVHAFWFVALALLLPDTPWLTVPACIAVPLYTMLALRRAYGGRRWPRVLRALLVTALYGLTLALAVAGVGLWALLA